MRSTLKVPTRLMLTMCGRTCSAAHAVLAQHTDGIAGPGAADDDPHRSEGLGEVECLGDAPPVGDGRRWRKRTRSPNSLATPTADDGRSRMISPGASSSSAPCGGTRKPGGSTGDDGYRVLDLHRRSLPLNRDQLLGTIPTVCQLSRAGRASVSPGARGGVGRPGCVRENRGPVSKIESPPRC